MTPLKLADRTSTATAPAFRQRLHPLHNMKKTFVEFRAKLPILSGLPLNFKLASLPHVC
ncbi:MAG: hypothetical protein ABIV07_03515 [Polaromonas sp.]